jgi:hypothetical protein
MLRALLTLALLLALLGCAELRTLGLDPKPVPPKEKR